MKTPAQTMQSIRIQQHEAHPRITRFSLCEESTQRFLDRCEQFDTQSLSYIPFQRFIVARCFLDEFGDEVLSAIQEALHDRNRGGLVVTPVIDIVNSDRCLKLATAIAHLIGIPNFDAMTGAYYAQFVVQDEDGSDSYLRQAYRDMTLHTDGTYVDEPTDWIIMLKSAECNATGGRSRLLHLDDWEDLDRFSSDPFARHRFLYKSPASKNVGTIRRIPTFYTRDDRPCISFIDQFAYPESIEHAEYLHAMSQSLEHSPSVKLLSLGVGELILLNNHFWLHGREAFAKHSALHREMIRMRGEFT